VSDKRTSLSDAITRHVQPGDVLHPVVGHTRWSAATREVVRQFAAMLTPEPKKKPMPIATPMPNMVK
jgi:hypothetical protein